MFRGGHRASGGVDHGPGQLGVGEDWLMANGVASSDTEAASLVNRVMMARRVGSASAANVLSKRSGGGGTEKHGNLTRT